MSSDQIWALIFLMITTHFLAYFAGSKDGEDAERRRNEISRRYQ